MKNESFIKISWIARFLGIALIVVCCFLPFASGLTMSSGGTSKSYGPLFSFFFMGKLSSGVASYQAKTVAVLPLIGYIFVIISLLLLLLSFLKYRNNRISPFLRIAALLFTLAFSVMFLCSHRSLSDVLAYAFLSKYSDAVGNTIYKNTTLDFAVYGMSVFGFLASLSSFISLVFDSTIDKLRTGYYR